MSTVTLAREVHQVDAHTTVTVDGATVTTMRAGRVVDCYTVTYRADAISGDTTPGEAAREFGAWVVAELG